MKNTTTKTLATTCGVICLGLAGIQSAHAGYTETQYPVVLVHGLAGFDDIQGAVEYFNGIPAALEDGGAEVFVTQISAANSSELRGEQLLAQVEDIVAATGAEKVNLIGHSHGAPTARYVAGVSPDLVASVSTVGGVNWGSAVADVINDSGIDVNGLGDALFSLIDLVSSGGGLPQSTESALASLTTAGSVAFNQNFPDGVPSSYCGNDGAREANGVRYYSWGGNRTITNVFDPSDYLLAVTSAAFDEPNDGLVSACSQKLGQVLNVGYRMNHLDEVNQLLGLKAVFGPNPVDLFRQQANRLKRTGL